jgi:hypothetical protein
MRTSLLSGSFPTDINCHSPTIISGASSLQLNTKLKKIKEMLKTKNFLIIDFIFNKLYNDVCKDIFFFESAIRLFKQIMITRLIHTNLIGYEPHKASTM